LGGVMNRVWNAFASICGALIIANVALGSFPAYAASPASSATVTGPAVGTPGPATGITHEENDRVPAGAAWTEAYFPSADHSGVQLHADVLRPANLPDSYKTPVILAIGPYFGHAGQTGPEGWTHTGPSSRFADFTTGTNLFARGYTYVMVDLRGFGGSTGCLDWVGPGEQADVRAAILWAARQPWSTGAIGMYGKSYDAVTGLVGNDLRLPQLKAVVAQEPVWNMYNYLFSNEVPRPNVTGTPRAYNDIATIVPLADDTDQYKANAGYETSHPECLSNNITNNNNPDVNSAYWRARNLARNAVGTTTPLFITQGFIENNTKPEDMQIYLTNHIGPERGWMGQWEHVRGNETDASGRLLQGRAGFFDEVMRLYDFYLKGIVPSVIDPRFALEDSTGLWRAQPTWPTPTRSLFARINNGSYVDDGRPSSLGRGGRSPGGEWVMVHAPASEPLREADMQALAAPPGAAARAAGDTHSYFTWSRPTTSRVRITATPKVGFWSSAPGNVQVRLWDYGPDGNGVMFDENVSKIDAPGRVSFDLKSTDWTFAIGHQLGIQIGTIGTGSWRDTPTGNTIAVTKAGLMLALQDPARDRPTQGDPSPFLSTYLRQNTAPLHDVGTGTFRLSVRR
jgi:putative CocE/NonD family hydrolase